MGDIREKANRLICFFMPDGNILPRDHPDFLRLRFIRILCYSFILFMLGYSLYGLFIGIPLVSLFFVAVSCFLFFIIRLTAHSGYLKAARICLLTALYLMMAFSLMFGKKEYYSLIWMVIAPVITFYLTGSKVGLRISLIFIVILCLPLVFLQEPGFPFPSIINLVYLLIILTFIMYQYEKSKEDAFNALEHSRQELYSLSRTDSLTGLYNRLCIDQILSDHFSAMTPGPGESPVNLVLMMIDIDHFKIINDTFGHQQGDVVLKTLARVLGASIRAKGAVGRWGGEEFLVSLPGITLFEASTIADEIRRKTESLVFENPRLHVTVSLGLAAYKPGDQSATLIKKADDCLYIAKDLGRNRVYYMSE